MQDKPNWVKGDMVYTVGFWRLDRLRVLNRRGRPSYITHTVNYSDMLCIEKAVLHGIGLSKFLD